jgi:carnitine 3-dehydrogenase
MRVALVGGGVIGGGWAGRLVENGLDVVVFDPHPDAERRVREVLANAERAWARLTYAPRTRGSVRFAASLGEAVRDVELVQESVPEDEALKRRLYGEIEQAAPPDALIASSTSGIRPTRLQEDLRHPARFLVAHPFNPVYLLPLVEVVGGERTSPEAVAWASDFFRHIGKSVITMDREVPGFIANRLQEAMWREALHMVAAGEATVEQIDLSITDGPGLRWAIHGPLLTFHLAGGQGGMAHMLDHFGPSLQSPWTRLVAAELTPELRDAVVDGCDREAAGRSIDELVQERDRGVIAILRALDRV